MEVVIQMGNGDIISRQAAIKAICEKECDVLKPCKAECESIWAVKELPSVQPRKGKWIRTRTLTHDGELYCNQCDQEHPEQKLIWNFCPNCGADMRGE